MEAESDVFCEDTAWVNELQNMPRAKVLMDHLAALNTIAQSGGGLHVEPPIEQCATWLRAFCHAYAHTDTPFDIVNSSGEKRLPKSVAICNLSGKHSVFYSEKYSLAKVLCLVAQDASTRLIRGVMQVINKAEETGGSVIVCFCLPFQAGLERVHWTVRTIRKTASSAVKDGELCFTPFDEEPREVPCTASVEHWSDNTLVEVGRIMANNATPVCLDRTPDDTGVKMNAEQMASMIEMLKTDRRKTLELHKSEKSEADERHQKQLLEAKQRQEMATHDADVRVSKVASASKIAENTIVKKMKVLEEHNASLHQQLAAQKTLCKEQGALLNGQKLEHEHELKQFAARQKTLEAQVATITANHARQVAEHAKQTREAKESAARQTKKLQALQTKLATVEPALLAVEASARQCRSQLSDCERRLALAVKATRVLRAGMVLANARTLEAKRSAADKEAKTVKHNGDETEREMLRKNSAAAHASLLNEIAEKTTCIRAIKDIEERLKDADECIARFKGELSEACAETDRQTHLAKETQKRADSLVRQLAEAESRRLAKPERKHFTTPQTSTVNVSQSTAVYMATPAAQAHYGCAMDPALENAVSQLHSSLNCITALARSSSASARQVDTLQAKLDALFAVGISQQCYYDPHVYSQV